MCDRKCEASGDSSIHRITAALEHSKAHISRDRLLGHNHFMLRLYRLRRAYRHYK